MKNDLIAMEGVILETLPNAMFTVQLDNGFSVLGYASGKIRRAFIKLVTGDRVKVEVTPYDLSRGRITYRFPVRAAANQSIPS